MDRRDLESLTRDELLAHARAAGVDGAEWLSREELVAVLSRGAGRDRGSGIFDRARALIDRARRTLRRPMAAPEPPPPPREPPPAPATLAPESAGEAPEDSTQPATTGPERFETLTMAEVYAAQGLPDEARRIARSILGREPDHAGAKALLDRLGDPAVADDAAEEPPAGYDEDVVCLHLVRADVLYAWWEVTLAGRGRAQTLLGEPGRLVLRLSTATPSGTVPRDMDIEPIGDAFLRDVMPDARHRVAVGLVGAGGRFVATAHSAPVWTPRVGPSADTRVEWLEVPLGGRSRTVSPPTPTRRTPADVRLQGRAHRAARDGEPGP